MRRLARLVPNSMRPALRRVEVEVRNRLVRSIGLRGRVHSGFPVSLLQEPGRHVFFGYFDISPFSADGRRILAHRVDVRRDDPQRHDAETGFFDMESRRFVSLGETALWCWQMGARLRWMGSDSVAFNTLTRSRTYGCAVVDAGSQEVERMYDVPLYDVSPDGRVGLSLDFSRLQRLRPGYGYARQADRTQGDSAPGSTGIDLVDLRDGRARMLISVAEIARIAPQASMADAEHYLNHLSFSPTGRRFAVFHLWHGKDGKRRLRLLWFSLDGTLLGHVPQQEHISHMAWQTDNLVLAFARMPGDSAPMFQLIDLDAGKWSPVLDGALPDDGHPGFRPGHDGVFISDGYPDKQSFRPLYICDLAGGRVTRIAAFHSPPALTGEIRCDLHPRWSRDGGMVAVDTAHLGRRTLAIVDLREF